MRLKKLLSVALLSLAVTKAMACTTIIVGKDATQDGSIILGRNDDAGKADWPVHMVWHPKSGDYLVKSTDNNFTYRMPKETYSYTGIPDWDTHDKTMEEVGLNEYGVAVSATESIYSSKQALAVDPYLEKTGIIENVIPSIILPQIKSAREGVLLLGKIIETQGAGEGFGVIFADKNEVWYLENGGGHEWVAVKIPADKYFISANQGRIQNVNLKDSNNYLSSPNLIQFAMQHGLYNEKDGEFNFSEAFTQNIQNDVTYNQMRVWTLQNKYTPSFKNEFSKGKYPVFLKPDATLSLNDVKTGLQNYYQGTSHDPYTNQNPKETFRPIAVFRGQQSHIIKLRPNLPLGIANVEYVALGMNALSVYIPFYQGATQMHPAYAIATDKADNDSAFWRFRKLQVLTMQNFPKYAPIVQTAFAEFDRQTEVKQAQLEKNYLAIYKQHPDQAKKVLDNFTTEIINVALKLADDLTNQLFTLQAQAINQEYLFFGA